MSTLTELQAQTDAERAEDMYLWLMDELTALTWTSRELADWTNANTERIYEALEENHWSTDTCVREWLFEHAQYELGLPYRHFYDRWFNAIPVEPSGEEVSSSA